eukprot:6200717-Pleurochrysis_carterae.AAC.2
MQHALCLLTRVAPFRAHTAAGHAACCLTWMLLRHCDVRAREQAPASAAPASATASAAGEAEKASDEELREQAKRAKERGNKRFQGRQFQRAIEEYTEAINISPDK